MDCVRIVIGVSLALAAVCSTACNEEKPAYTGLHPCLGFLSPDIPASALRTRGGRSLVPSVVIPRVFYDGRNAGAETGE